MLRTARRNGYRLDSDTDTVNISCVAAPFEVLKMVSGQAEKVNHIEKGIGPSFFI
jgi:hypothetical protein